jgi:hypothetical protein
VADEFVPFAFPVDNEFPRPADLQNPALEKTFEHNVALKICQRADDLAERFRLRGVG